MDPGLDIDVTFRSRKRTVAVAFAVVFVAELGDKSQLMALTFGTRFRPWRVLVAIAAAAATTHGLSALAGRLLADRVPTRTVTVAAGLAFLGFAWWTWRTDDDDEPVDAGAIGRKNATAAMVAVGATIFLAEAGDKTMLATVALSARDLGPAWTTWVGATAGMVAADGLAIAVGRHLGTRLPRRTLRIAATLGFGVFGLLLLVDAASG